jgi:hypothetical protein
MSPSNTDTKLAAESRKLAAHFRPPKPEFSFVVAWPSDYEHLFADIYEDETDEEAILDEALRVGRVLLHGEGGTGKSTIVRRLFRRALDHDVLPVLVDMRRWDATATAAWEESRGNDSLRIDLLLRVGEPSTNAAQLMRSDPDRRPVLMVDGLNEAPAPIPDAVLSTLDAFARRNPHAGVLITDRLVRRRLPSESWSVASIVRAQLPGGEAQPPGDSSLTRVAFFLDLILHEGSESTSGSRAFREYLDRHAGLRGKELLRVAHAAYEAYRSAGARTFPLRDFRATAGGASTVRLLEAGTLVRSDGIAYFRHHLFHDFLAGLWLAGSRRRWRSSIFDSLTFGASSFDVLSLALEEIERPDDADALLRSVYDWNYYGSAYALSKGRALGTIAATDSMEVALLAMLAERRWDPLLATAQRVEDALRLFPGSLAGQFLSARDLDEVIEIVEGASLAAPFEQWRALFTTPPGAAIADELVEELTSSESLMGWTTANVLKRVQLTTHQRGYVRELLLQTDSEIVRWRAAHVLGSVPERDTAKALFEALGDRDQWVRYGAVRSLVEVAVRDDHLRGEVLSRLRDEITELVKDPKVIGEFERAILLRDPPHDWIVAVAPIIEELWGGAETLDEQDHWRQVALRVRRQAVGA